MSDEIQGANVRLTPDQMFGIRGEALRAASQLPGLSAAQVLIAAQGYLSFMLNGLPAVPGAPAPAENTAAAPATKPKKAAPAAAPAAAQQVTAPATPAVVAQPVTLLEAANSLRALVQTQQSTVAGVAGAGRVAAIKLLEKYGVKEMAQIPPAKLADFKAECDATKAQLDGTGQVATTQPIDPLQGLMG